LFPSRIGEFVLGMLAAVIFVHHRQKLNKIFLGWIVVAGFLIWLMGSALVYINRFGWIASDFFISLGSIIVCINLAWFSQKHSPSIFSMLSMLGAWSYYIYLIHNLFRYVWFPTEYTVISLFSSLSNTDPHGLLLLFATKITMLAIFGSVILLLSWFLMKFDQSKMPKWLIQNTIARFLI
jgi:peptidoglycan/LPS O-acetylase OafA/YrhL